MTVRGPVCSHSTVPSEHCPGTEAANAHCTAEQEEDQTNGGPPKYGHCKCKQVHWSLTAERALRGNGAVGPPSPVVDCIGCKDPHAAHDEPDEDEETQ